MDMKTMSLRDRISGLPSWLKGVAGRAWDFVKTIRKQKLVVVTTNKEGIAYVAINLSDTNFAISTKESFTFSRDGVTISFDGESRGFKIEGTI